jgi:hypothetical protein
MEHSQMELLGLTEQEVKMEHGVMQPGVMELLGQTEQVAKTVQLQMVQ